MLQENRFAFYSQSDQKYYSPSFKNYHHSEIQQNYFLRALPINQRISATTITTTTMPTHIPALKIPVIAVQLSKVNTKVIAARIKDKLNFFIC